MLDFHLISNVKHGHWRESQAYLELSANRFFLLKPAGFVLKAVEKPPPEDVDNLLFHFSVPLELGVGLEPTDGIIKVTLVDRGHSAVRPEKTQKRQE